MNPEFLEKHDDPQMTPEAFVAYCNAPVAQAYGLVDMVTTMNYLTINNIWDRLKKIEIDPAKKEQYGIDFVVRISKFLTTVQFYPKTNYSHFVADTGALVFLHEITQEEADGFLALAKRDVSRWESWGGAEGEVVTVQDVNALRWKDQAQVFASEVAVVSQRLASLTGMLQDLETGNAYHDLSEVA